MPARETTARWIARQWSSAVAVTVLAMLACRPAATPTAAPPGLLPDSAFVRMVLEFSEPEQYFDTDNLISNESSYLDVVGALTARGVRGGAYLGVGPGQNFSYIARIQPAVAFLIDIRRDNLLQHLWYKALFTAAPTRIEHLTLLYARVSPPDPNRWRSAALEEIIAYVDSAPVRLDAEDLIDRLAEQAGSFGVPLSREDRRTIRSIQARFVASGLDLRFVSHGRPPRSCYPNHRDLVLATDLDGVPASYLAREEDYQFVRALQTQNRIIPVVGNLAGAHALTAIADYLTTEGLTVSAFYTSNVEFYLMMDGTFDRFVENVERLPSDRASVIIRSAFDRGFTGNGAGGRSLSCSRQSLQPLTTSRRVGGPSDNPRLRYRELISRDTLALR